MYLMPGPWQDLDSVPAVIGSVISFVTQSTSFEVIIGVFSVSMKKLTHLKSAQTQVQLQIQVQAQHMDLRREARYTSPISRTWSL